MEYKEATTISDIKVGTTVYIGEDKTAVTVKAAPRGRRLYEINGVVHFIEETFTETGSEGETTITSNGLTSDDTVYVAA